MASTAAAHMSLRAYAKRRGCSAMAVSKAVKTGRLKASVVYDDQGDPKIRDPALADKEWEATTDHSRAPGYVKERAAAAKKKPPRAAGRAAEPLEAGDPPPPPADVLGQDSPEGVSLAEASAAEKFWKAKLAEQDYRERTGELVEAKLVTRKLVDVFTLCRAKLLVVPTRARQALPHLTVADVGTIETLIREALEELAASGGDPAADEEAALQQGEGRA